MGTPRSERAGPRWFAVPHVVVLGLAVGLVAVDIVCARGSDPFDDAHLAVCSALALSLLVALCWSAWRMASRSPSRRRHVFSARRSLWSGGWLVLIGGAMLAALVLRSPFDNLFGASGLGAPDAADLGVLLGSANCLIAGTVTLLDGRELSRVERNWPEHL